MKIGNSVNTLKQIFYNKINNDNIVIGKNKKKSRSFRRFFNCVFGGYLNTIINYNIFGEKEILYKYTIYDNPIINNRFYNRIK